MPQIGDEVVAIYRDADKNILEGVGVPEILRATAYGRLQPWLTSDGQMAGIVVASDGGATFIPTESLISVELVGEEN